MHLRSRLACAALSIACLLRAAAPAAAAGIELELRNGNTVMGAVAEGGGSARFLVELPQGARLTASAKTLRRAPPVSVAVLDESDAVLAAGADRARTSVVTNFEAPATARYAIEVKTREGASAADYSVTVRWKSAPRVTVDTEATADGGSASFVADADTTFTGTVRAGRRSRVVPRIVSLEGPGGFTLDVGATKAGATKAGATKAGASTLRDVVLPRTGEYVIRFEDDADVGGPVRTEIKLQQAISRERVEAPGAIDLGGSGGGADDGGVTPVPVGVARVVGPSGAAIEIAEEPGLDPLLEDIVGAAIVIPRLALPTATAIVLATSKPILPVGIGLGGDEVLIPSGPAVFFGPEGTEFEVPVTITIPIDDIAAARPDDVFVLTRTASGATSRIENVTVSSARRTVTFAASHFSSFQAFVRGVPSSPQKLVPPGVTTTTLGTAVALDGDTLVVADPGGVFTPGQAFVYRFVERQWHLVQRIVAPDNGSMGRSAALDGDTLLLGGDRAGYVYVRSEGLWSFQQRLVSASVPATGTFGACDIDGDTAVLGAMWGNAGDGEVYVFVRSGGAWTEQQRLVNPEAFLFSERFGSGVALEGDVLLVGAPGANSSTTGDVHAYSRSAGSWSLTQTTRAPGPTFGFGSAVALDGDTAAVSALTAGAVRLLTYTVTDGALSDETGFSTAASSGGVGGFLALRGDTIVLGAPFETSSAGAAFVYVRSGGIWTFQQKLTPVGATFPTRMGTTVAIDGDRIVLGAPGDARDDAAYAFERVAGDWTR